MKHHLILYVATLFIMTALDVAWIGGIARDFYRNRLGAMLEFHAIPGVLFYLLYALGIVVFINGGDGKSWQSIAYYGAFFGLIAYATYDLTNMATLKDWSTSLSLVDMAWGMFVTAASATAGWFVTGFLER